MKRLLLFTLLTLGGCPEGGAAPAEACVEVGARCRTPEGPIGVCIETSEPGEASGRESLRCAPQH